jgi:hypothetical protein
MRDHARFARACQPISASLSGPGGSAAHAILRYLTPAPTIRGDKKTPGEGLSHERKDCAQRLIRERIGGLCARGFTRRWQTGADFYKGKTVTYIVATPPGGGYDFYGRLIAEYMQKHLPGSTSL